MEKPNLLVYNSLTGEKEVFKPIHEDRIGMYVCGPTVYYDAHLGNCRTFISFDIIYRYLMHLGFKVRYVRNITDVGHLENQELIPGKLRELRRTLIHLEGGGQRGRELGWGTRATAIACPCGKHWSGPTRRRPALFRFREVRRPPLMHARRAARLYRVPFPWRL